MASVIPAPSSQKADVRPISFMLVDPTSPQIISQAQTITLAIRPEELTRTDPSRLSVHQTLGGAWQDNFGPGIATISITGHTGWHRTQEGTQTPDGVDRWIALRKLIYVDWHARKQNAIKAGRDPDQVQLIFADALDQITSVVALPVVVLRRSKARPLLYQYQISMTVLSDIVGNPAPGATTPQFITNSPSDLQNASLTSAGISIGRITALASSIASAIDSTLLPLVTTFMLTTSALYNAVTTAVGSASAAVSGLTSVAHVTAQVGLNVFRTVAAATNGTFEKATIMEVAAEYSNMLCLLVNGFNQQLFYEDYLALYGSSNCSSTNGGSPPSAYANKNPFLAVVPTNPLLPVTLSTDALTAMHAVAANDPVLSPFTTAQLVGYLTSINSGLAVVTP